VITDDQSVTIIFTVASIVSATILSYVKMVSGRLRGYIGMFAYFKIVLVYLTGR